MKNIHILPTDKPSRLSKDENGRIWLSINFEYGINDNNKQNIYITNDEEIKEGDWFLTDDKRVEKYATDWRAREWHRKIILTTDPSLAPDVQKIDDEFLKWFVKNPSCEEVEVFKDFFQVNQNNPVLKGSTALVESYKIIIPKEEPKQVCENCKIEISKWGCGCGKQEEPKHPKVFSENGDELPFPKAKKK